MGIEREMNRREFLKMVGAAALSIGAPQLVTDDAEAAQKGERLTYPILGKLQFNERNYNGVHRTPEHNFRKLVPKGLKITDQQNQFRNGPNVLGTLSGVNLVGTPEVRQAGRIERSLRFKNISDAVEFRYNLPPGLVLAMVMQESYGADMYPNAWDDGGIGLAHMQPSVAQEFGLATYKGNRQLKDKKHGEELRQRINEKNNVFQLATYDDDRFNRLLNLDAVGRMLATHMGGKLISPHGPLDTSILRYAGRYNFKKYRGHLHERMSELHNPAYLVQVAKAFDERNRNLIANGVQATERRTPFALYLETFWKENEEGFDLRTYKKLPAYEPSHSREVLKTYRSSLVKTQK